MNDKQEIALVRKIAGGDASAENALFLSYREQIECMVRIRLKVRVPVQDQEDIVSEIQEAVLLSLRRGGYDPATGKTPGAYIAGIVPKVIGQYFKEEKEGKHHSAWIVRRNPCRNGRHTIRFDRR